AGVSKNLGAESDVRLGRGVAAHGTSSSGSVAAEFHLAGEDAAGGALAHEEQYKIGGLAAELKTEAAAFEGHHCGSAPRAAHVLSAAAGHDAAAIAGADNEGSLQDRREHDDTIGLVDHALRNVVRNIHNLFHYPAGIFDALILLRLCEGRKRERRNEGE